MHHNNSYQLEQQAKAAEARIAEERRTDLQRQWAAKARAKSEKSRERERGPATKAPPSAPSVVATREGRPSAIPHWLTAAAKKEMKEAAAAAAKKEEAAAGAPVPSPTSDAFSEPEEVVHASPKSQIP